MEDEIAQYDRKIEATKFQYFQALSENFKKDIIIEGLEKKDRGNFFNEFLDIFSRSDLDMIRSFDTAKREDPSFVRQALQSLYADNLSALKNKSVTGTVEK